MSSDGWRAKYEAHIRSARWRNMKLDMIRLRGDRCEHCGRQTTLHLHHKTYERLGRELIADLELLCARCHQAADKKREQQGAIRSAAAMYDAAMDTYASKKYGDDWETRIGDERLSDEFDEWLERKESEEDF
jgi:phage terminase large subunit GpA-like protein